MRFRWLGTAGFEFSCGGETLLIDPYLTRNPRAFPRQGLRPADLRHAGAVLVTHGHFDHAADVPEIARLSGCRVFASASVCRALGMAGVPWRRLEPLRGGDRIRIGPFLVEAVPSRHVTFDQPLIMETVMRCLARLPELAGGLGPLASPAGEVLGYLLQVEGQTYFHLGSAWLKRGVMEGKRVDVFLVPAQGRSDITSVAARLTAEVKPQLVVPHHHDDFYPPVSKNIDLGPFRQELEMRMPDVRLLVPSLNLWLEA